MNIFARYLLNQGDAADGKHNPIVDWIWWAWNDNSGDTGGVVSIPPRTLLTPRLQPHAAELRLISALDSLMMCPALAMRRALRNCCSLMTGFFASLEGVCLAGIDTISGWPLAQTVPW
jgi:hypothetical protein